MTRDGTTNAAEAPVFGKDMERGLQMIADHSEKVAVYYDISTGLVRVCRPGATMSDWLSDTALFALEDITQESQERLEQVLCAIRQGNADGEVMLQLRSAESGNRWLKLKYSSLKDEQDRVQGAILSYQDVSEHRRYEMAYLRQKQAVEQEKLQMGQLEADLSADIIDAQSGRLMLTDTTVVGQTLTSFKQQMVELKMLEEDREEGRQFFSPGYLLDQYEQGNCVLTRVWKMHFRGGTSGWVRVEVELVREPYTEHIKAFFELTDITVERENQLSVKLRAEKDGLTGLLNRATMENRIKECMQQDDAAGVLVLMDMDDLKKINDTYGHLEGDKALRSVAQAMKQHFRQTDIIGRLGGDEFLLYLRGAAKNPDAIAASLTAFLHRLSALTVGDDGAHRISGSIGCAVQSAENADFETLYRQADVALYHVKRCTKNGFAFYDEDMQRQDYQFRRENMLLPTQVGKQNTIDGQRILDALRGCYQMVLSMNLTADSYFLATEGNGGAFGHLPVFGSFEDFVSLMLKEVHPEDRDMFQKELSRDVLTKVYTAGTKVARSRFRFTDEGNYRDVEATALLYEDGNGDVCGFMLLRWD